MGMIKRTNYESHGLSRTPEYAAWKDMRRRCNNPNDRRYHAYGARGISVCSRWGSSFAYFIADMGFRPAGYSLERKDNNRGYCPENCMWALMYDQHRNRRDNVHVALRGEVMILKDAARRLGLADASIIHRSQVKGETYQEAVNYYAARR